jgi:starvation-inducible DNA-binding protein
MHQTRNDMPLSSRTAMAALLNQILADTLDLYSHAKQAHWNVRGPNFAGLHGLFDAIAEQADGHADLIAERAVQLGAHAKGTVDHAAAASTLPPFGGETSAWRPLTDRLAISVSCTAQAVRTAISAAEKAGDAGTADLFTQVSRDLDKSLWMLEAHLDADTHA